MNRREALASILASPALANTNATTVGDGALILLSIRPGYDKNVSKKDIEDAMMGAMKEIEEEARSLGLRVRVCGLNGFDAQVIQGEKP